MLHFIEKTNNNWYRLSVPSSIQIDGTRQDRIIHRDLAFFASSENRVISKYRDHMRNMEIALLKSKLNG